jgi:hypothetical protein
MSLEHELNRFGVKHCPLLFSGIYLYCDIVIPGTLFLSKYGRNRRLSRQAYQQDVRCCAEERWSRKGARSLPWLSPVSDDEELVEPQFGHKYKDYRGSRIEIQRPSVDLASLAAITCEHLGISIEKLS